MCTWVSLYILRYDLKLPFSRFSMIRVGYWVEVGQKSCGEKRLCADWIL